MPLNNSTEENPSEEFQHRDEESSIPVGDHCPNENFEQGGENELLY